MDTDVPLIQIILSRSAGGLGTLEPRALWFRRQTVFEVNTGVRTDKVLAADVDGAGAHFETEHGWRGDGEAPQGHLEQTQHQHRGTPPQSTSVPHTGAQEAPS